MAEKRTQKKEKRIEPALAGGFRDYLPTEAIARKKVLETVRSSFESFGFEPIETPAVEKTDVLTGSEEDSGKIIFNVKGSQEKKSDTSLRFDLTVPLARFVAANPNIPKPFKRYQIGNVWRGERPQAGRYREFMQADIDIVGSSSLDADAEIVTVIYETLKKLGLDDFVIKINNRKILNELPEFIGFDPKRLWSMLRIIDKKDKIGEAGVLEEVESEFDSSVARNMKIFLRAERSGAESMSGANEGAVELDTIRAKLDQMGLDMNRIVVDPSLVRGLGYYTGPVFETVLTALPEIGSIFSGGRYDNLVMRFTGQPIAAVGASLGVDRLFTAMQQLDMFEETTATANILIMNLSEGLYIDYMQFARKLRDENINVTFYAGDDKAFGAQLSYAVKKNIPFVLIYGDNERLAGVVNIKNLTSREQTEVEKEKLVEFFKG